MTIIIKNRFVLPIKICSLGTMCFLRVINECAINPNDIRYL